MIHPRLKPVVFSLFFAPLTLCFGSNPVVPIGCQLADPDSVYCAVNAKIEDLTKTFPTGYSIASYSKSPDSYTPYIVSNNVIYWCSKSGALYSSSENAGFSIQGNTAECLTCETSVGEPCYTPPRTPLPSPEGGDIR